MRSALSAFVLGLALTPTAALPKAAPSKPKPPPPVRYVCEDGTRLLFAPSAPGPSPATALLRTLGTGHELTLTQAESADGGRYVSGKTEFWDKGATATFTQDGTALSCRVKR